MATVTQIRHRRSDGRAYYDRQIAEGKTRKEALRSLKRRVSDAFYRHLHADARRLAAAQDQGAREGNRGTTLPPARPGLTRAPALRPSHSRIRNHPTTQLLSASTTVAPKRAPKAPEDLLAQRGFVRRTTDPGQPRGADLNRWPP